MTKNLRIAFFGTPDFAVASLKKIVENDWNVVAVITAPDKPSGRGQQLSISDVKKYALEKNLTIYQPEKMKSPDFVELYRSLEIDLAVVVAFRMMPEVLWSAPKIGTINLHGSLLPNYRGAAPINWAIINGEQETGVTTFFINHEIDKGDILFQSKCKIEKSDDFGSLYGKLKEIGADLLQETLEKIEEGNYHSVKQDFKPTDKSAPKIDKEILEIKDFHSSEAIYNLVRGLIPVYKPFFMHKDKKYIVKNGSFSIEATDEKPGEIITDNSSFLKIACNNGYYWISEIQAEGKKPMDIRSFFNGNQFKNCIINIE
jgi:methionyl-tRNA formyltransferase